MARAGERLAALEYSARGYEILARNWRCAAGEIDLVVASSDELVFCEVKTRSSSLGGFPEEAVSPAKQKKLRDLAAAYLSERRTKEHLKEFATVRFDVVSVLFSGNGPPEVRVFEDAF